MNLAACAVLATHPENQVWFRAIQPQHWAATLATAHTRRIPSRFSTATNANPSFPLLYLAEDHLVALFEVGALLGSAQPGAQYLPNPRLARVVLNVRVTLQQVVHLTDVSEQTQLETTAQELTGDWRGYALRNPLVPVSRPAGFAPTQLLGAALHGLPEVEGFRFISAKIPTRMNLAVFPDKPLPGSLLQFTEPATGQTATIPP